MRGDRRRSSRSRPVSIGKAVPKVLAELGFDEANAGLRVAECWEEVVGAEVAGHCRPTLLRGSVLEVRADSSVWCQQLQLRAPEMLAALRRVLGDDAPSDLWFRVS